MANTLVKIALLFSCISSAVGRNCTKDSNSLCKCTTDDGYTLDLAPIAESGTLFKATQKEKGITYVYKYRPCNGFYCRVDRESAVCLEKDGVPYDVGTQLSVKFHFKDGLLQAFYISAQSSTVILNCSKMSGPGQLSITSVSTNTLLLSSRYACLTKPNPPTPQPPSSVGLSIGSYLLITSLCIAVGYVIGGVAFQVLYRKERGVGVIPNRVLWTALAGFVRDGVVFILVKIGVKEDGNQFSRLETTG